ncbi:MAG: tRNA (guanosine(46)-N7)-methyltransferase TrmB [Oscillospiraceae bacterium]|jgi:tRNA (guanine-N7-)-methyltransferase|nr:tRNA (guanosine(46)-N7)-methyltransferase TrmB [Oscillospiraceae bacterium]
MRRKSNLPLRLARCAEYIIPAPEAPRGGWTDAFPNAAPASGFRALHAELGCGKGLFIGGAASAAADVLFVGIERVADAAVVAAERAREAGLRNVRFIIDDVSCLPTVFAPGELGLVYINFCDPWPGKKRAKRRLTSDGYLSLYADALAPGGEIRFKTDSAELFGFSLERFKASGFALSGITRDLHGETGEGVPSAAGSFAVMTDYERKFHSQGVKICACAATKPYPGTTP